ncbi:hypothetical protein [Microbacterium hominis]|uniref:hypothetical protein n=1 Tax=Microbacterium hominis TaxID=162426 RepID=UPI00077C5DFB|nr:hypothetical protein [Microbacterium hominis]
MSARRPAEASDAAATVQKVSVLLESGVAPGRAWELLAEDGDPVALRVATAPDGAGASSALRALGGAWVDVAAAWQVAETVGAPLASSLRRFADTLRGAQEARDDVRVALADPTATARLVTWLPVVAVLLGMTLGFDLVATLTQPIGIACAVAGIALMLAARGWTKRLVARAQPDDRLAGMQAEVVAIALSGGVSIDRALATAEGAGAGRIAPDVRAVLRLSQRAGAPAVDLLRAGAAEQRRAARTEGRLRAARLGASLLLPMGVCTLPAFLLLGVAPLLLSVVGGAPLPLGAPAAPP